MQSLYSIPSSPRRVRSLWPWNRRVWLWMMPCSATQRPRTRKQPCLPPDARQPNLDRAAMPIYPFGAAATWAAVEHLQLHSGGKRDRDLLTAPTVHRGAGLMADPTTNSDY